MQTQLASVDRLDAPDQAAFRSAAAKLGSLTRTAEEAVEIGNCLIRLTKGEPNTSDLLYETIHGVMRTLEHLQPRPPPEAYLNFLTAHNPQISKTFAKNEHPLVSLVEIYTRLFIQDRRRLDPFGPSPRRAVLDEIERLRQQHLHAVRAIHKAMDASEGHVSTQRSTGSLMSAYGHGQAFAQVQQIWVAARADGGTGIDSRTVAVVSTPSCPPAVSPADG